MKKFFDKIKVKWRDNKVEFLLQSLSLLLAIALLCIGFTTTLSAEEQPLVDNTVSVGIYEMKLPSTFPSTDFEISINFKATYYDMYFSSIRVRNVSGDNIVEYFISSSTQPGTPTTGYLTVAEGDYGVGLFSFISIEIDQTLSATDYAHFGQIFGLSTPDLPDDPDDPDPPDDGEFIIPKGSYVAGTGFTFPNEFITGDISFTAYDSVTSETMRFSSLRIGVRNDIAYIEYFDVSDGDWLPVYADGWQSDSYKAITVLYTAYVTEEFYNKFNQIFNPSTDYDAGFTAGYDEGFWNGKQEGYDEGYRQGYLQGSADSGGDGFVGDMISSVFEGLDNAEIYANYSILDLIKTIIGIFGAIWLLKLLAGG